MTDAENIGFAIPIQTFSMGDFIAPKEKEAGRLGLGQTRPKKPAKSISISPGSPRTGMTATSSLTACAECYRVTPRSGPLQRPSPYQNLGTVFNEMGKKDLAAKYFEAELRIDPNRAYACTMISGRCSSNGPSTIKKRWTAASISGGAAC